MDWLPEANAHISSSVCCPEFPVLVGPANDSRIVGIVAHSGKASGDKVGIFFWNSCRGPLNGHAASGSGSWSTHFSPAPASAAEPGSASSPAARHAYLAAELRAAQTLLERGGKGVNVAKTKARIRELEERQRSAWAMRLE
ncbi:hypothetical protein B0H11DRAFT_2257902 [Mycena galericulata]|nr:hypothetical protein B0H11DRAFT_2257902 [Mycena galericulata]